jgi:hypothetical protein
MVKRGPKTNAEFRAEGVLIPGMREPAPADLEPGAAALWDNVIVRLPEDWFTTETRPLFKAYCRHSDYADRFAREIINIRETITAIEALFADAKKTTPEMRQLPKLREHLLDLHRMHGFETDKAASCATKLRLTNQSRYVAHNASAKARNSTAAAAPPWHSWTEQPVKPESQQ